MDVRRPYNIMEIAEEKLKEILKEQREEYQYKGRDPHHFQTIKSGGGEKLLTN